MKTHKSRKAALNAVRLSLVILSFFSAGYAIQVNETKRKQKRAAYLEDMCIHLSPDFERKRCGSWPPSNWGCCAGLVLFQNLDAVEQDGPLQRLYEMRNMREINTIIKERGLDEFWMVLIFCEGVLTGYSTPGNYLPIDENVKRSLNAITEASGDRSKIDAISHQLKEGYEE